MIIISFGRKGGLPIYAKSIISRIIGKGCNFWLFQSIFSDYLITNKNVTSIYTFNNKFQFILSTIFVLPFVIFMIIYKAYKLNDKKIYFPYYHMWSLPIIYIAKLFKMDIYFTVHDSIMHKGDFNILESFLLNHSIKESNNLIFLTEHVKNETKKILDLSKKNLYVSKLGYVETEFDDLFVKKNDAKSDSFLFLGRVSKYKGVELLLESFINSELLINKKLTIAGKSNYSIDYNRYSKISNLTIIDEFLSDSDMINLINNHDVLVLPYLEATQSGILTFAIKSNIQIILTDVGGLSEQIPDSCANFCSPTVESLMNMIENVCDGKYNYKYTNLVKYSEVYNWDNIVDDLLFFVGE
ncbi:TPA: glycosyltransferase [Photobacterium damselae]